MGIVESTPVSPHHRITRLACQSVNLSICHSYQENMKLPRVDTKLVTLVYITFILGHRA